ncbi:hypothetical protein [Ureibacillus acetophenoni]|nr:hypothetical protein [Ureibacillus acetophenoni]
MDKEKNSKKKTSKKVTRFKGETKMSKENEKALKMIRSIKGKFG